MMKRMIFFLIGLVAVGIVGAGYFFGFERCQDQIAYDYSPYCLRCNERNAEKGDAGAAYNLALYFEGRDSMKSASWIRIAANGGDRRAVSRALTECGDGKLFSYEASKELLKKALQRDPSGFTADALDFYLGSSCGPLDLVQVRKFDLNKIDDDLKLCRVALRYGQVVAHGRVEREDQRNANQLLRQCVRKANPDGETYREASRLLGTFDAVNREN